MNFKNKLTPSSLIYYVRYCCSVHIKQRCNFYIFMIASAEKFTNFINVFLGELSHRVEFSLARVASSFLLFVEIVKSFCADRKMLRINTIRVITRMHNYHSVWNGNIIVKFKSNMRCAAQFMTDSYSRIFSRIARGYPFPTIVFSGFNGFLFHSFRERSIVTIFISIFVSSHIGNYITDMGKLQGLF